MPNIVGNRNDPKRQKHLEEQFLGQLLDLENDRRKNPKKQSKSKLKKDIEDSIKLVESIKIPKKTKSKNLSKAIEITELIAKTPKTKKINSSKVNKEIQESIDLIDKLIKADKTHLKYHPSKEDAKELKSDMKLMKQAKGYVHKVSDVSQRVKNYVSEYKSILTSGKTPATITKNINKLKLNIMTNMKPSEVDDANKLIADFRKTLPSTVKAKVVKAKVPKEPSEDADYQKKLKSKIAYIKKNKPSITDPEDIKILADEMIGKNVRSSKKCLEECLSDLGMSGSGFHKIKGGMVNGEDEEDEEEEDEEEDQEEEEDEEEEEQPHHEQFQNALFTLSDRLPPTDLRLIGHKDFIEVINAIKSTENPRNRELGNIYNQSVIPEYGSSVRIQDTLDVLYALENLNPNERIQAIRRLASALRERRRLSEPIKELKKHKREDKDPDVKRIGRKPRSMTSGIAGIGMKFKQALQQESKNKYRLF